MVDFYLRFKQHVTDQDRLRHSRVITFLWALVLFALAMLSLRRVGRVVEAGLQIASVAYGALLGVFLLGVLTRRASQKGAMVGMLCGFATELYLWTGTRVAWTWWVAIGSSVTFIVGYIASLLFPAEAS
jgi:Na+(H+)/acetate symporter ActP